MRLTRPHTPEQALRLVAAVLTVVLVVLLGGLGTSDPEGPTYHHYVAMGDSFTAAPYVPLNDVAYGCNRSSNNYPHLVARALHIDDLKDRSCTGAQTVDLYDRRQRTADGQSRAAAVHGAVGAHRPRHGRYRRQQRPALRADGDRLPQDAQDLPAVRRARRPWPAIVDQLRPELVSTLEQVKELAPVPASC